MTRSLVAVLIGVFAAASAVAQEAQAPAAEEQKEGPYTREEKIIVSASKVETLLINSPNAATVVTSQDIEVSSAQNIGDLLRPVPGVNPIQLSARDINLTSRQATSTLANSQLALLDGRTIYLDFFGLILWDFVPTNPADIKQIEVVRGPASAVWGANALTGVVNIITKTPREAVGTNLTLTGGLLDRKPDNGEQLDSGYSYGASASFAKAPNDRWSYKLSAGYYHSDPFARPTGKVALGTHPLDSRIRTGGGTYSSFPNSETNQPKFDLRIDQETSGGSHLTYGAGIAGTEGIIHTGIGPFDIQSGSYMGYGKIHYAKGGFKFNVFSNFIDVEAPNLQTVDVSGKPIVLNFKTQTFDAEIGHFKVLGKHVLSYGGNARRNSFDITIAPNSKDRNEFGAYFQDEIFFDRFRFVIGGRVDKFGNLDDPVFSPRLTAMFKPTQVHAFRVSFNKAFRSPSTINNYLDIRIGAVPFPLGAVCPLAPPLCADDPSIATRTLLLGPRAIGSEVARQLSPSLKELQEESVTAYEVGYTGTFSHKTTVSLAFYINDTDDNVNLVGTPSVIAGAGLPALFSSKNPPPGWPFPTSLLDHPALRTAVFDSLPALNSYLNLGPVRNKGFEASIDHSFTNSVSGYINYSWQGDPEVRDPDAGQIRFPVEELSTPPRNRFNAGINCNSKRYLGSASVNYTDKAYWNDVLPALGFDGFTDSFTMVNATFGVKWNDGKVTTAVKATNLFNQEIQQHIFGDIIKRNVVGEIRFSF